MPARGDQESIDLFLSWTRDALLESKRDALDSVQILPFDADGNPRVAVSGKPLVLKRAMAHLARQMPWAKVRAFGLGGSREIIFDRASVLRFMKSVEQQTNPEEAMAEKYYVHFIDDDPVRVYGPYSLKSAKDFARIGSQPGKSGGGRRAVFTGQKPSSRLVRVYEEGERVWPRTVGALSALKQAEVPRVLAPKPKKGSRVKMAANPRALPRDVLDALRQYRAAVGRNWKAALRELWLQGLDEGALRRARNILGPSGLSKLKLP